MNINYSSMKQVHNTNKSYHHYWGKASKKDCSYHLLVYHSLDVAAVGILLADRLRLAQHMAKRLDYDFQELLNIIAFLCAIHDIGKFSDGFQNLRPDLYKILKNTSTNVPYQERHGSLGYRFLCENVQSIL
ncbi:MAG: CRISPR-associated endonuclease Cas3'', partial [Elusimicrobia bacterium]|nr:CRISPR-associated endonuclease Cas3'' [Elusimicrobiota bacterium]